MEKTQCRLDVCLLDAFVLVRREQKSREDLPDLREGRSFDFGESAGLIAERWIVFGDAILVHRNFRPYTERNKLSHEDIQFISETTVQVARAETEFYDRSQSALGCRSFPPNVPGRPL